MALYDLVTLRKALEESVNADKAVDEILMLTNRIESIKMQVPVMLPEHASYINELIEHYDNVIEQISYPVNHLHERIALINQQIEKITKRLFDGNYEHERNYGPAEDIRIHRRIYINEEVEQFVSARAGIYTDWRFPALEIGCRDGEWTKRLVAADPLYIVDRHTEFLDSTVSKFTEEYQRRLRKYQLVNHNLKMLPEGQFALVFSWTYFNYISVPTMRQYLTQVFDLLRPGGVFMFSYNDADTPSGAGMAEKFAQSYLPFSLLLPMAQEIGFELIQNFHPSPDVSWIEIRRPGVLETVKGHQVMGEIRHIST